MRWYHHVSLIVTCGIIFGLLFTFLITSVMVDGPKGNEVEFMVTFARNLLPGLGLGFLCTCCIYPFAMIEAN
ncbi:MAG: hypothetical protein HWN66_11995, partial [Candidatus Helarchaeota archaeon]|nr:hypothetical protein [Candidatus Helarchaeota archaeon]